MQLDEQDILLFWLYLYFNCYLLIYINFYDEYSDGDDNYDDDSGGDDCSDYDDGDGDDEDGDDEDEDEDGDDDDDDDVDDDCDDNDGKGANESRDVLTSTVVRQSDNDVVMVNDIKCLQTC